jgi:Cu/Zn superoxide dismutase
LEPKVNRLLPVVAAASVLLAADGSAVAQDAPDRVAQVSIVGVTVELDAQNGSGETGTATFTPQGNKTQVVLQLTGAPADAQPAHIHEGSCAKLNPAPKIPLQNVVNGKSTTVLDMPINEVMAGGAVNVHKSTQDLKTYVACGDLKSHM